jgi:hypothetical protein
MDSVIATEQTVASGAEKFLARVGRPSDIGSSVGWASVTPPSCKDDHGYRALTEVILLYRRGLSDYGASRDRAGAPAQRALSAL